MATKEMTPKQAQIKSLQAEGKSVGEIAKALKTSAQAVYAQLSRMRKQGHLPGSDRKPRPRGKARRSNRSPAETPPAPAGKSNGALSLDDHLQRELEDIVVRLAAIESEQSALAEEQATLSERKARLAAANNALHPPEPPKPAQAAEQPPEDAQQPAEAPAEA